MAELRIRDIDEELHIRFKMKCVRLKTTIQDRIKYLMEKDVEKDQKD